VIIRREPDDRGDDRVPGTPGHWAGGAQPDKLCSSAFAVFGAPLKEIVRFVS